MYLILIVYIYIVETQIFYGKNFYLILANSNHTVDIS